MSTVFDTIVGTNIAVVAAAPAAFLSIVVQVGGIYSLNAEMLRSTSAPAVPVSWQITDGGVLIAYMLGYEDSVCSFSLSRHTNSNGTYQVRSNFGADATVWAGVIQAAPLRGAFQS